MQKPTYDPLIISSDDISCEDIEKKLSVIYDSLSSIDEDSLVLDFGCGDGKIARGIIEKFGCRVVGVDISKKARELALLNNPKNFLVLSPRQFQQRVVEGLRFDAGVAVDVVEYSPSPVVDLSLVKASLKDDALVYITTSKENKIPTKDGFINMETKKDEIISTLFKNIEKNIYKNIKLHFSEELSLGVGSAIKAYRAKDFILSEKIYDRLIKLYPYFSELRNSEGVICRALKKYDKSKKLYQSAITLNPTNSFIYSNYSNLLKNLGELQPALLTIKNAIRCDKNNPNHFNSLGIIYEKLKEPQKAELSYQKAIEIDATFSKSINNLAVLYYNKKEYEKAIESFKEALRVDPKYYEVYSNLGATYNKVKNYDEAIKNLNLAIKHNPKNAGAYTNLGNVYNKQDRFKEAMKEHLKSIKLDPNGVNAYSNLANSYKSLGYFKKAKENYIKAIELDPNFTNAHFDLATTYLHTCDFINGFEKYEKRFDKEEMMGHLFKYKDIFSKPKLLKTSEVKGKTVLVHSEQGFGDSIQFARFVPLLKEKFGCEVILQCRDELKTLFENSIEGVDSFYKRDSDKTPQFDFQIAMLSLPHLLEVKSIDDIPKKDSAYLFSNEDIKVNDNNKVKIGICWGASVTGESYEGKVFDIREFDAIIKSEKIEVYSLQVGEKSKDINENGYLDDIVDITEKLDSFNKTAALINRLDLVISSDTSVAHLAGALGVEVWVPLQKMPDWRWESKGKKSYLYKNAKLFRQKSFGKWDSVFQSITDKLNKKYKLRLKYNEEKLCLA